MNLITYSPGNYITVTRGTDKRIATESGFFYQLKLLLNSQGGDWIKKNKVPGLNSIPYALRIRKGETYIYDDHYAVRRIEKEYNAGQEVTLNILG